MSETLWAPAVTVLGVGFAAGVLLAGVLVMRLRRRRSAASVAVDASLAGNHPDHTLRADKTTSGRLEDLRSYRVQLIAQLRDLQDTASAPAAERLELERQAALVLRELAALDPAAVTEPNILPRRAAGTGAAGTSSGSALSQRSPGHLVMRAVLVGAVILLIGVAPWQGVRPRSEGMGITGSTSTEMSGQAEMGTVNAPPGHPTERNARPIVAQDTPRLRAARERVNATPQAIDARIELGYALAEAGGWIEFYQNAEAILAQDPNNADGLIQQAMLRFAMHQPAQADAMIDQVLARDPANIRALEVGGRLALSAERWSRAEELLARAVAKSGPNSGLEPLLMEARRGARVTPGGAPTGNAIPSGSVSAQATAAPPPASTRGGSTPGGSATTADGAVTGTIALADGVTPPVPGGIVFVMARPAGVQAGPPIAATRLSAAQFPVPFRIDASNAMMGGTLPDVLSLSARLDADGNAATKDARDLVGTAQGEVKLGSTGINIILQPAAR